MAVGTVNRPEFIPLDESSRLSQGCNDDIYDPMYNPFIDNNLDTSSEHFNLKLSNPDNFQEINDLLWTARSEELDYISTSVDFWDASDLNSVTPQFLKTVKQREGGACRNPKMTRR